MPYRLSESCPQMAYWWSGDGAQNAPTRFRVKRRSYNKKTVNDSLIKQHVGNSRAGSLSTFYFPVAVILSNAPDHEPLTSLKPQTKLPGVPSRQARNSRLVRSALCTRVCRTSQAARFC